MYCVNCGKILDDSSKYCKSCGSAQLTSTKERSGAAPRNNESAMIEYAGFKVRLGAYLADFFFFSLIVVITSFLIGVVLALMGVVTTNVSIGDNSTTLIVLAGWLLYSIFFLISRSRTPGKVLYGLIVLDELGKPLASKAAIIRSVCQPMSTFFFGIGYWRMKQNDKNLTWHDKMAHTVVIVKQKKNYLFPIFISTLGLIIYLLGLLSN